MKQRTVFFDSDVFNGDGNYSVHPIVAESMRLEIGEPVIAIQGEGEWDAKVVNDNGEWGLELLSDARRVNAERRQGHIEGFWEGIYSQLGWLLIALERLDLDEQISRQVYEAVGITPGKGTELPQTDWTIMFPARTHVKGTSDDASTSAAG
jgi:hypothetical protein